MHRVYVDLARAWLPCGVGVGLKTDLFEEGITSHHLLPELGPGSIGLDCSLAVVRAARARLAREKRHHRLVVGDLRQMPLRSGSVSHVLSGSSLDHFAARADLDAGLAELARVLAPGGVVLLTLDNPHNPLVWLRNQLPFSWLHCLGLVPYFVGVTYGADDARARLEDLGLRVTEITAVAHAPRAPAIWVSRIADKLGTAAVSRWLGRLLVRCERLQRWPTRYRTGYYVALRARKPGADDERAGALTHHESGGYAGAPAICEVGGPLGVRAVSR
jgi:SAM-dependent methyltransferase